MLSRDTTPAELLADYPDLEPDDLKAVRACAARLSVPTYRAPGRVKLLLDAQLPRRLARDVIAAGHDAIHPSDLTLGNSTPDSGLVALATRDAPDR